MVDKRSTSKYNKIADMRHSFSIQYESSCQHRSLNPTELTCDLEVSSHGEKLRPTPRVSFGRYLLPLFSDVKHNVKFILIFSFASGVPGIYCKAQDWRLEYRCRWHPHQGSMYCCFAASMYLQQEESGTNIDDTNTQP